jgi:hypothetical protein
MCMNVRSWIVVSCLLLCLGLIATSQPAAAAGVGETCGGIAAIKCDAGLACRYPINQCKVADLAGKCVRVPDVCPKKGPKVCGCDGKTYDNMCELLKAGVAPAKRGACGNKDQGAGSKSDYGKPAKPSTPR